MDTKSPSTKSRDDNNVVYRDSPRARAEKLRRRASTRRKEAMDLAYHRGPDPAPGKKLY